MTAALTRQPQQDGHASAPAMRRTAGRLAFGALFWLAFLLVLEPGNLVRAARAGLHPSWAAETLRIMGASLLGAPAWPLILWLAGRFPIRGEDRTRIAVLHSAALGTLALAMIVIGHGLAAWMPPTSIRGSVGDQIASNILLMVGAMAVLDIGAHLARSERRPGPGPATPDPAYLDRIAVPVRGRTILVDVSELDWIEAQGNYLGLRKAGAVHLVRDTLTRFHAKLDPKTFVRIHRRTIVNLERVQEVVALGNGDALVKLRDGAELRASRGFGDGLRERLREGSR